MEPGAEFRIRIDSRVWNSSLTKDYGDTVDYVEIVSNGFLFIDPSAQVSQPTTDNDYARVSAMFITRRSLIETKLLQGMLPPTVKPASDQWG